MRVLIFLLLITGFLVSCGSNAIPSDIIASQKMETIMWQLMQSDEYVNMIVAKDSTKKSSVERMIKYQQVFELNNTSLDEFKKSYQFYISHPDIAKAMFDSIGTKASRQRMALYNPKIDSTSTSGPANMQRLQMEKRRADSLAKAGKLLAHPDSARINDAKNRLLHFQLQKHKADSITKTRQQHLNNISPAPADTRSNMLRFQLEKRRADSIAKAEIQKVSPVKQ